jgi:transcription antitermination factor NusG
MNEEPKWYAIYTRQRWEKKVAGLLEKKGIECYCPLNKTIRQWSDRKKVVEEPLFNSYVFVKTIEKMHNEIKGLSGVINLVYWLSKPAIIRNEEIDCIKSFLKDYNNVRLEKTCVAINDTVKVTQGPLMEYEGNVIAIKSKTVKILLPSLGYMMVAEVEKMHIKKVNNEGPYEGYRQISREGSIRNR